MSLRRPARCAARIAALRLTLATMACDGVGEPVIGEFATPRENRERQCPPMMPPPCAEPRSTPAPIVVSPPADEWKRSCGLAGIPARETLDDARHIFPRVVCRSPDAPVVDPALAVAETLVQSGAIRFQAAQPSRIQLAAARLTQAHLELAGPISLELTQGSVLSDVRIDLTHPGASLTIREGVASTLIVNGSAATVDIAHTHVSSATFVVANLVMDTSVCVNHSSASRCSEGSPLNATLANGSALAQRPWCAERRRQEVDRGIPRHRESALPRARCTGRLRSSCDRLPQALSAP